jgi:hypothetical protein
MQHRSYMAKEQRNLSVIIPSKTTPQSQDPVNSTIRKNKKNSARNHLKCLIKVTNCQISTICSDLSILLLTSSNDPKKQQV